MTTATWIRHVFKTRTAPRRMTGMLRPLVEALEDRLVPAPLLVTSTADSGPGTLRAAITAANRMIGPATIGIDFVIGTPGSAQTIKLTSPLPAISASVRIDGTSQGGDNYSGPPLIELNGTSAGPNASGLELTGNNSVVEGLTIDHFAQDGIVLRDKAAGNTIGGTAAGAGNVLSGNGNDGIELVGRGTVQNLIEGNFIGTNAAGTAAFANRFDGIVIRGNASSNSIGGTATGAGNVISGNGNDGIEILNQGTTGNLVQGNDIGTNLGGTGAIANKFDGIVIRTGAGSNSVGGKASGAGTIISGNGHDGIEIVGEGTTNNLVQGNTIGAKSGGTSALSNAADGIAVRDHASDNTIGGTDQGAGNIIAFNGGDGVLVGDTTRGPAAGTGNAIEGNSIFGNKRLGIFLGFDDTSKPPVVLANNSLGHPKFNNSYQNYPVLNVPRLTPNGAILSGTISSPNNPGTQIRIEFFVSNSADPTGFGQGQFFFTAVTVTTNSSGMASFSFRLPSTLKSGQFISATATDAAGNTSEFSRNVTVP